MRAKQKAMQKARLEKQAQNKRTSMTHRVELADPCLHHRLPCHLGNCGGAEEGDAQNSTPFGCELNRF
jgi:hypothetical protein